MSELFLHYSGRHLQVTTLQAEKLYAAFPGIWQPGEFERIDAWLDANPRRRPRNQYRFLVNWFQKQPKPSAEITIGTAPRGTVRPDVMARIRNRENH